MIETTDNKMRAEPIVLPKSEPRSLWHILTDPHSSIKDVEIRQQSRLLSMILLALIVSGGLIIAAIVSLDSSDINAPAVQGAIVILGVAAILYVINRFGRFWLASITLVSAFSAVFIYTSFAPIKGVSSTNLVFLFVPIMLAAIFFNLRGVIVSAASILILGFALNAVEPHDELIFWTHRSLLYFLTLGSILIITFILHLNNLEKIRRTELTETNRLLQASFEQIREINEGLEVRIEERTHDLKVAKEEAEAARERAEKADQIKSQFLASMSHELRTPLNSILTFTQLLGMGTFGPVSDEQKEYLDKSLGSGRHLLALINDVLDITKIQSGMMTLFVEPDFDTGAEVKGIADIAEKLLADKPVKLISDIDRDLPSLTCDKRRVRQVLLNLVSNAVKFTEKGTITLSAKARPDTILFAVIDTGPGIAPEEHQLVFDAFVQTETGMRHGGSGLGLPISKSLVEAHGGRLWLESKPGEGAAFYVSLPLKATTAAR